MQAFTKAGAAAELEKQNISSTIAHLERVTGEEDLGPAIEHLRAAREHLEKFGPIIRS